ncbi:MAG: hypothetical protein H6732_03485 [Alphaproteobacteria bacterium]|nr:hypothetical protein [Alphaproteobacteria bacterium]
MRSISLFVALAGLVACGTGSSKGTDDTDTDITDTDTDTVDTADTADTDDTDDTDVPVALAWNENAWTGDWKDFVDCGTAGKISFEIEANGEGVAAFYVVETRQGQTSPWSEYHTLDEGTPGAGFAPFARELTTGATVDNWTTDSTTFWKCGKAGGSIDPAELGGDFKSAFYVGLWSPASAALLGDDDVTNDPATPDDCVAFGFNVDAGYTASPVSKGSARPGWVTKANCRTLSPVSP